MTYKHIILAKYEILLLLLLLLVIFV